MKGRSVTARQVSDAPGSAHLRDTAAATVGGDGSLRLFLGLRLAPETLGRVVAWQSAALTGARGRPVPAERLHMTLAFLGRRPVADVDAVATVLREEAGRLAVGPLVPTAYRETRSVGMVICADPAGHATKLAERLQARLEGLGLLRPERRAWLPHLTVLRFRARPRLSPAVDGLGPVCPSDAALYHSELRSIGAQYEVLESVALGG